MNTLKIMVLLFYLYNKCILCPVDRASTMLIKEEPQRPGSSLVWCEVVIWTVCVCSGASTQSQPSNASGSIDVNSSQSVASCAIFKFISSLTSVLSSRLNKCYVINKDKCFSFFLSAVRWRTEIHNFLWCLQCTLGPCLYQPGALSLALCYRL